MRTRTNLYPTAQKSRVRTLAQIYRTRTAIFLYILQKRLNTKTRLMLFDLEREIPIVHECFAARLGDAAFPTIVPRGDRHE